MKQEERPKVSIVAGLVLCSRYKCEYDLEIPGICVKIDKEIIDREAKLVVEIIETLTNYFKPNNPKRENGQEVFLINLEALKGLKTYSAP